MKWERMLLCAIAGYVCAELVMANVDKALMDDVERTGVVRINGHAYTLSPLPKPKDPTCILGGKQGATTTCDTGKPE